MTRSNSFRALPQARFTRKSNSLRIDEDMSDRCVICRRMVALGEGTCEKTRAGHTVRICNGCNADHD